MTKFATSVCMLAIAVAELAMGQGLEAARPAKSRHVHMCRDAVICANRAATLNPVSDRFVSAVQVYPWSEGAVFKLLTSPGKVSDILLEPGENLGAVASGDTVRWIVGNTTSGSGADKQVHVLVKPSTADLSTNIIITTDRRTYHLELDSTRHIAMEAIRWTYPQSALISLQMSHVDGHSAVTDVQSGIDVTHLSFGYQITGDTPVWRPVRVFDDGRQSFIEFPPSITTGEAPPLFIVEGKGQPQLVNYRVQGRFYVVDRLFETAELRLGGKTQKIVRISRTNPQGASS